MLQEAARSSPTDRRNVLALAVIVAAIALALFFMRPERAKAGLAWCASDPIISVNGQLISVVINVPVDQVENVEEAVVTFHVPWNVDAKVIFVDQSFFPEKARIVKDQPAWNGRSKLAIPVDVYVESEHRSFPIRVKVMDATGTPAWYDGFSDRRLSFTTYGYVRPN